MLLPQKQPRLRPFFLFGASVRRENRPPCAKGALPEGRWGIVSAGREDNPSVTLRVPPPFAQGRLLRTANGRPYTCLTGEKASLCKGSCHRR